MLKTKVQRNTKIKHFVVGIFVLCFRKFMAIIGYLASKKEFTSLFFLSLSLLREEIEYKILIIYGVPSPCRMRNFFLYQSVLWVKTREAKGASKSSVD